MSKFSTAQEPRRVVVTGKPPLEFVMLFPAYLPTRADGVFMTAPIDGEQCLLVFTNRGLLGRYLDEQANESDGAELLGAAGNHCEFADAQSLCDFLSQHGDEFDRLGCRRVAVNFRSGRPQRRFAVAEFVAFLNGQNPRRD